MRHRAPAFIIISLALLLNGCALSSFTIASMALNGLSYATSGKSVTDHALSTAMHGDCSLFRVISGDRVCLVGGNAGDSPEEAPRATVVATAQSFGDGAPSTSLSRTTSAADRAPEGRSAFGPESRLVASATPASIPNEGGEASGADAVRAQPGHAFSEPSPDPWPSGRPQLFVVLGSFQHKTNAERRRAAHEGARLAPAMIDGIRHFRVVLGPFGDSMTKLAAQPRSPLRGGADRWPVWLCPGSLAAPPCSMTLAEASTPD